MVGWSVGRWECRSDPLIGSVGRSLQGFYSIPLNRGLGDLGIGGFGDWGTMAHIFRHHDTHFRHHDAHFWHHDAHFWHHDAHFWLVETQWSSPE